MLAVSDLDAVPLKIHHIFTDSISLILLTIPGWLSEPTPPTWTQKLRGSLVDSRGLRSTSALETWVECLLSHYLRLTAKLSATILSLGQGSF